MTQNNAAQGPGEPNKLVGSALNSIPGAVLFGIFHPGPRADKSWFDKCDLLAEALIDAGWKPPA